VLIILLTNNQVTISAQQHQGRGEEGEEGEEERVAQCKSASMQTERDAVSILKEARIELGQGLCA
jgi:hypothetical protein